jgi:hypothetical protein
MSEEAPLVKGGVLQGLRYPGPKNEPPRVTHATFTTTCPPIIEEDAIIIGIASPNFADSDPAACDGWFLSDFYAFNYLFKGCGSEQVWISPVVSLDTLLYFKRSAWCINLLTYVVTLRTLKT